MYLYQDGTFSFEDFATTFDEYDVQRVMRSYENSISIHVHCCEEGEWKQVGLDLEGWDWVVVGFENEQQVECVWWF